MRKSTSYIALLYCSAMIMLSVGGGSKAYAQSPIDPCLNCHVEETPEVVQQWEAGKHSKTGVKCYVCHHADEDGNNGVQHHDFFIAKAVDVRTCESCHPENAQELKGMFSSESGKHP